MSLQLIGVAMLIAAGAAGGCFMAARLKKRTNTLKVVGEWIKFLQTEFHYHHTSLTEVLAGSATLSAFQALSFLHLNEQSAQPPTEKVKQALKNDVWSLALDAEDVAVLERMLDGLGKTSLESQLDLLEQTAAHIALHYEQAYELHSRKGRIFRVMGICAATAVALVLC